ncbi:hypothetical protein [Flavobacterium sp.]
MRKSDNNNFLPLDDNLQSNFGMNCSNDDPLRKEKVVNEGFNETDSTIEDNKKQDSAEPDFIEGNESEISDTNESLNAFGDKVPNDLNQTGLENEDEN